MKHRIALPVVLAFVTLAPTCAVDEQHDGILDHYCPVSYGSVSDWTDLQAYLSHGDNRTCAIPLYKTSGTQKQSGGVVVDGDRFGGDAYAIQLNLEMRDNVGSLLTSGGYGFFDTGSELRSEYSVLYYAGSGDPDTQNSPNGLCADVLSVEVVMSPSSYNLDATVYVEYILSISGEEYTCEDS